MHVSFLVALIASVLSASPTVGRTDKNAPEFLWAREPAEGVKTTPPSQWSTTENVAWKFDIPGLAWSSPIVWDDKIFVTTCVSTGERREPKKGLYLEELNANKYPRDTAEHIYKVLCLDLLTGKVLWEQVAHRGIPAKPHHIKNTLASETPATDGERIYALFGNLGMFCYDLEGKLLWTYHIEPKNMQYGWGTSMSPTVHGDRVYIVNDNEEESWIAALDKRTGKEIWKTPRDPHSNFSTPFVWENPLRTEIVVNGRLFAISYDMEGKELWRVEGKSAVAIPRPFERFGLLYVTSGHVAFGENRTYAIRPGASGNISPVEGKPTSEFLEWHSKSGPYHPTPLIIGENMYVLLDRGFMACYNAKTGKPLYEKQRIPGGRAFTSSPWTYDGKIFCLNEDGVTFVCGLGPKFELLHRNELADDDMGMATPVIVGDKLLIRTAARLYCIGHKPASDTAASKE
ncbi:MAG: PQQ-binding-like beta-propeller repeat protein [Planctomycetota bacterium]